MIQWRKSSRSQGQGQGECVEISTNVAKATLIRDSKDPQGPRLTLDHNQFAAFLSAVKIGRHEL